MCLLGELEPELGSQTSPAQTLKTNPNSNPNPTFPVNSDPIPVNVPFFTKTAAVRSTGANEK